jgi:hypothetical protein
MFFDLNSYLERDLLKKNIKEDIENGVFKERKQIREYDKATLLTEEDLMEIGNFFKKFKERRRRAKLPEIERLYHELEDAGYDSVKRKEIMKKISDLRRQGEADTYGDPYIQSNFYGDNSSGPNNSVSEPEIVSSPEVEAEPEAVLEPESEPESENNQDDQLTFVPASVEKEKKVAPEVTDTSVDDSIVVGDSEESKEEIVDAKVDAPVSVEKEEVKSNELTTSDLGRLQLKLIDDKSLSKKEIDFLDANRFAFKDVSTLEKLDKAIAKHKGTPVPKSDKKKASNKIVKPTSGSNYGSNPVATINDATKSATQSLIDNLDDLPPL